MRIGFSPFQKRYPRSTAVERSLLELRQVRKQHLLLFEHGQQHVRRELTYERQHLGQLAAAEAVHFKHFRSQRRERLQFLAGEG